MTKTLGQYLRDNLTRGISSHLIEASIAIDGRLLGRVRPRFSEAEDALDFEVNENVLAPDRGVAAEEPLG